jgi:glutamate dehydrogenase/leucine dehydrogenase
MPEWMKKTDAMGPEKIVHVYDPQTGMKGVVVIDCTALGSTAAGGIRMLPDITTEEIFRLARAMTYKFGTLGVPIGGAKSGIWADPGIRGEERKNLMRSFGRAVKPLIPAGLAFGADIGTEAEDLDFIFEGAGLPPQGTGLMAQKKDGEPIENHVTGYGVVVAAKAACEFAGIDIRGAAVAIEGFGKVGGGVARYITEAGARVVAISTVDGMILNRDGLDVALLLERRKQAGDRAVGEYEKAEHLAREAIFSLPVDILVPGARPYVIDGKNVEQVKAEVVSSIANIPITEEAEERLFQKGILVVPDFVSNAGGTVLGIVDFLGGTSRHAFDACEDLIGSNTRTLLADARKAGVNPRRLATGRVEEKIAQARRGEGSAALDEAILLMKERLGI